MDCSPGAINKVSISCRKILEDLQDDVVLVSEVVVQIARANVHGIGNVVGTDVVLALSIEELETGSDNSVSGFQAGLP